MTTKKPKLKPLTHKEVKAQMDHLREIYEIPKDMKGDIEECRRILSKCKTSLSEELQKMRDEERGY